jgi:hypothetical protein
VLVDKLHAAADRPSSAAANGGRISGPGLGILLGCIYLVLLFVFAVLSFRKGHWVLGLIGFVFPILWIVGAMLPSRYVRR